MIEIVAFLILCLLAAFALGVHFERYMERRRRKRAVVAGDKTAAAVVSTLTAPGGWGLPREETTRRPSLVHVPPGHETAARKLVDE